MTDVPTDVSAVVRESLLYHLTRITGRIHALVDPLSTDELWTRPYPYGNSVGHLLLHLTGNLNYFIGAQMAGTGFVRDRPREFNDTSHRAKADVLADFDRAIAVVVTTISAQKDDDWGKAFEGADAGDVPSRLSMIVRCVAHADHHAGQMIYLCKQLAL